MLRVRVMLLPWCSREKALLSAATAGTIGYASGDLNVVASW